MALSDDRTAFSNAEATRAAAPSELVELTSARGFAAFAVVLFHIDGYSGQPLEKWFPVSQLGMLAVDFFFVLSGFVLAHVYGAAWREGRYSHRDFVVRRFARVWPLHFVCLIGVGAIVAGGSVIGLRPPWPIEAGSFVSHLLLLNATGLWPQLSWNQPAWSVGAEWSAYLAFPAYLMASLWLRPVWLKIAASLALLVAMWAVVRSAFGLDLLSLDANGGVLRIIPSFFAGVVLREIWGEGYGAHLSEGALTFGFGLVIGGALTALYFRLPSICVWPALPAIIYLLALRARRAEAGVLRLRPLVWLGDVSYALYLVHALVLMIVFSIARKILGATDPVLLLGVGLFGAVVAVCIAALAHRLIERPAQRFILTHALRNGRVTAGSIA